MKPNASSKGFSLVEFLGVIAIVAILSGLGLMALRGVTDSLSLQRAANTIQEALDFAKASGASRSRAAAVALFYRPADTRLVGVQAYLSDPALSNPWVPLGAPRTIGGNIVISESAFSSIRDYSAMLTPEPAIPETISNSEPGVAKILLLFHSDTSMEWSAGSSITPSLTLFNGNTTHADGSLPANYITFIIQPSTGQISKYRP